MRVVDRVKLLFPSSEKKENGRRPLSSAEENETDRGVSRTIRLSPFFNDLLGGGRLVSQETARSPSGWLPRARAYATRASAVVNSSKLRSNISLDRRGDLVRVRGKNCLKKLTL